MSKDLGMPGKGGFGFLLKGNFFKKVCGVITTRGAFLTEADWPTGKFPGAPFASSLLSKNNSLFSYF